MSSEHPSQETKLDLVVQAVAEARAREAGKSLSDYLADLLMVPHHGSAVPAEHSFEEDQLYSAFTRHLLATARDIRTRYDADSWARLVAGPVAWSASEVTVSPALNLVFVFNYRVQSAALLMSAAFDEAAVDNFHFATARPTRTRRPNVRSTWYRSIVDDVVDRSWQLRNALVHEWTPTPRAERLAVDAFVLLSDLTPAQ